MKRLFRRKSTRSAIPVVANMSGKKVLVVDDSATQTHVLRTILEKVGIDVYSASSGEDGLREARHLRPDLVLMDVVMPGMNGFQATRKLRKDERTKHIPVIMVTTKGQETDKEWGLRQGANDYLVKPVDAGVLIEKVANILNE